MSADAGSRRLAAILAADVVGYSRLIGADEPGTLAKLASVRSSVIDPQMAAHGGRVFKTTGDGLLAEFASGVQAVQCAIAIQQAMRAQEGIELRIGLHSADVTVQPDGDLLGDGVNVAARLETLAEPGGICISGRVREDAAGKLALEVEDLGEPELKNIAQRHRVFRVRLNAPERPALPLPDKPSLAVLPFQNMSGDPEQEYFADGVVEDITTALSRTGWLFVIARNSAFTFKGRAADVRQVGREFGVRYVLEGSVRRADGRVRISCQLIEASTGGHVWADRFESGLADIFELQDKITESVVGAIEPSLRRAEIARATAKPTDSLDAYDLYLRALPHFFSMTETGLDAGITLLRRALEIDPTYVRAKALLAMSYCMRNTQGWGAPNDRAAAVALAREAVAAATDDPDALHFAGHVLSHCGRDYPSAFTALNRALRLHPSSAQTLNAMGHVHCDANDPGPAINYFQRALRLSPLDPDIGYILLGLGQAHMLEGRSEEALPFIARAVQEAPNYVSAHRTLILALTRLGRLDDARAAAARLLELRPGYRLGPVSEYTVLSNREYVADLWRALAAAGIPE
jgi:adenylate cyclase